MQFQDESQAIIRKAKKAAQRYDEDHDPYRQGSDSSTATISGPSPAGESSVRPNGPDDNAKSEIMLPSFLPHRRRNIWDMVFQPGSSSNSLPLSLLPQGNDIATGYFFNHFTSGRQWRFLGDVSEPNRHSCLDLAIRACGMAALDNVRPISNGRYRSRQIYAEALSMLNAALRDPVAVKRDQSLIAVAILSYYENLTCDSRQSIESWKAHINGATQILRMRGKKQLDTEVGRALFRQFRSEILTYCIWDDLEPASFLRDWNEDLAAKTPYQSYVQPGDTLADHCMDFALLRSRMRLSTISTAAAIDTAAGLERSMICWGNDTPSVGRMWLFREAQVTDSPHFWNGTVHAFEDEDTPIPGAWNSWRTTRILLSRTQEELSQSRYLSTADRQVQETYTRSVRRQMADDICATIPVALGHANPASAQCVLVNAYGSIWPLFFAGTCALERVGKRWSEVAGSRVVGEKEYSSSAAVAQAAWVIGRLEYIARELGLRWAEGVAAALKGDYSIHRDLSNEVEWSGRGMVET